MTTISKVLISLSLSGALSYAENLTGKLLDSTCYDSHQSSASTTSTQTAKSRENLAKTCAPTASTTTFVLLSSKGTAYKLDSEGNTKAAAAIQNGSMKPDKDGDMHASISGTVQGDSVKLDSIHGRGEHNK